MPYYLEFEDEAPALNMEEEDLSLFYFEMEQVLYPRDPIHVILSPSFSIYFIFNDTKCAVIFEGEIVI